MDGGKLEVEASSCTRQFNPEKASRHLRVWWAAGLLAAAFSAMETAPDDPGLLRPRSRCRFGVKKAHPLLIGLRAARANLWPGLCLQLVMLLVVAAYYRAGWARPYFDCLAAFKAKGGVFFSIGAAMVAGAVLPEILGVLFFQRGRATRRNFDNLLFALVFWAINGATVDLFYRGQGFWFGTQPTVPVLVKKLLVDQFIYTGLFAAPFAVWGYEWKNRGYRTAEIGELFTAKFYVGKILPTMIANWGVWFPACTLIYCLPPLLQVPLFSLALTFWALILAYINSTETRPQEVMVAAIEKP